MCEKTCDFTCHVNCDEIISEIEGRNHNPVKNLIKRTSKESNFATKREIEKKNL